MACIDPLSVPNFALVRGDDSLVGIWTANALQARVLAGTITETTGWKIRVKRWKPNEQRVTGPAIEPLSASALHGEPILVHAGPR